MTERTLAPTLSIVAVSRNDDHGGALLHRMQLFINGLAEQCQRHRLHAELVLVEWNPPPDRPRLVDALSWPGEDELGQVRIIEVSPEVHRRFRYADRIALYQMIAKNAGIRRAQGEYLLATNVDILFSDEMMRFLVSNGLQKRCLYRVDRYDVPSDIPMDALVDDQLEYCRKNIVRICGKNETRNLKTGEVQKLYSDIPVVTGRLRRILAKVLPPRLRNWEGLKEQFILPTERARLHTNAAGDFTLMAREHWFHLRGYHEFAMFSFHIDALLCYMAYHAGLQETVLPYPIFHIQHSGHPDRGGWLPEAEHEQSLEKRVGENPIPRLTNEQFDAWAVQMRRERRSMIFNDENWGLVNENLPETVVSGTRTIR